VPVRPITVCANSAAGADRPGVGAEVIAVEAMIGEEHERRLRPGSQERSQHHVVQVMSEDMTCRKTWKSRSGMWAIRGDPRGTA